MMYLKHVIWNMQNISGNIYHLFKRLGITVDTKLFYNQKGKKKKKQIKEFNGIRIGNQVPYVVEPIKKKKKLNKIR